jgi:hypothetical protein
MQISCTLIKKKIMIEFQVSIECSDLPAHATTSQKDFAAQTLYKKCAHPVLPRVGEMFTDGVIDYAEVTDIYHRIERGTSLILLHLEDVNWPSFMECTQENGWTDISPE